MLTTQFATQAEIDCYCRMTLKQYNLADYSVVFLPRLTRRLGQANPWEKRIELSPRCLANFKAFDSTLRHEIAHCLQISRMGGTFKVNGRNDFHGKVFKQVCKEMGISDSRFIRVNFN